MKKLSGVILVLLAIIVTILFAYDLFTTEKEVAAASFISFILPLILFINGYFYLKKAPELVPNVSLASDQGSLEVEAAFDENKRKALIGKLKQIEGDLVILSSEFFDGNYDDQGSIGCNLYPEHPGISVFSSTFSELSSREDVDAIYVHVSEIEPDSDSWPYADRIYIFGDISLSDIKEITKQLAPTEIADRKDFFSPISKQIRALSTKPLNVLWWD